AEADRGDAVERYLDVVGSEIAEASGQQPDQAVEHNLQHRQPLVGNHRRVDDRADAGIVIEGDVGEAEAEQRVDLLLREDALGAAFCRLDEWPSSTIAAQCAAMASAPLPASTGGATPLSAAAFCSASSATPHSAASASWSTWSLNAMMLGAVICFDRI